MGGARMGAPVSDRPGPLRALQHIKGTAAQDVAGLRSATRTAGRPLVARPRPRPRSQQQLLVAALPACPTAPRAHRDYAPAPGCGALRLRTTRAASTIGRPRKAGRRLATLAKVAADTATAWQAVRVEHWYGGGARNLLIASATAVWRHNGLPVVPMRWVLIRDPMKPDAPAQALLCTDLNRTSQEIVTGFVRRWSIETTFKEVRTHLGVERRSVNSPTAPLLAPRPAYWACSPSSPCWPAAPGSAAPLRDGSRLVP